MGHSLSCLLVPLTFPPRRATLTCSLAHSLAPELVGQWNILSGYQSVLNHSHSRRGKELPQFGQRVVELFFGEMKVTPALDFGSKLPNSGISRITLSQ